MKVLLVNTFDHGGAAKASIRLHSGLLKNGIQSSILFLSRSYSDPIENSYIFSQTENRALTKKAIGKIKKLIGPGFHETMKDQIRSFIPSEIEYFSFPDTGIDITSHPAYQSADIVNLHWTSDFVDYSFFKKKSKPVVWTLHDMNAFTGGCHYAGDCMKYLEGCQHCPQLKSCEKDDYSDHIFRYKRKFLSLAKATAVVTPSEWLMNVSRKSPLLGRFPHSVIPNGKNSSVFTPHDRKAAREKLGLPLDKKIILFVSHSLHTKRKGYHILQKAMENLQDENIVLCTVGSRGENKKGISQFIELGLIHTDEEMSRIYSAADLFVIPSTEDNLPNTVIESLMCGTPVVGFRTGGIPDMIENGKNGCLVDTMDALSLAKGIANATKDLSAYDREGIRAGAVSKYDLNVQANLYISLYKSLLSETHRSK